jgi:phosphoinositide-3-kinase regulatory subunit 4
MTDYATLPIVRPSQTKNEQPNPAEKAVGRSDAVIASICDDWSGRIRATLDEEHGSPREDGLTTPLADLQAKDKKVDPGELRVSVDLRVHLGNPMAITDGPALLLLNILTAEIRNCTRASSRIGALEPLLDLCAYITDEDVLDRIVPYIVYLAKDDMPQVRAESCRVLVSMVRCSSAGHATGPNLKPP